MKGGGNKAVRACLQQEEKMRLSTKHSSNMYFNSKINVSKLVIPSAGTGCVPSWKEPSGAGEQDVLTRQARPL